MGLEITPDRLFHTLYAGMDSRACYEESYKSEEPCLHAGLPRKIDSAKK